MQFAEHVKWREEEFGAVVFDTLSEDVFVTNEVGRELLALIDRGLELPAVLAELAERYEGEGREIESDVREFVEQLQAADLLQTEGESSR